ncbi:hypothetical protein P7C71_g2453, partial [Lecanoromycetidae sp. Uapishka_2]
MDSQQYFNLSAKEMAVVASAKKNGTQWTYPRVHATAGQGSASGESSTIAGDDTLSEKTPEGEASAMDISEDRAGGTESAGLDDLDRELLGDDGDEDSKDNESTASAGLDSLDNDLLGRNDAAADDDADDSEDSGNTTPAGSEFPATPPAWLSEKDKTEWRKRQDHHDKMKGLCVTHRTLKGHTDWTTVLDVWNSTHATRPGHNRYSGGNTMATRMSRDKGVLLSLQAKKPANWDATH